MAISKIILNGVTQMDVTGKTVTANSMLNDITALKNDGTDITGNISAMSLPSSASGSSSGTSKATITPTSSAQYLNIPAGYLDTAQFYTIAAASGGASNIVTGTFKGTTTGTAMDVTLGYTGSGYPIAIAIYPDDGYQSGSSAYDILQRYSTVYIAGVKRTSDTPTYTTSGTENWFVIVGGHKNSSSTASNIGTSATTNFILLSGGDATGVNYCYNAVRFKSKNTMSIYVSSGSYGFIANITYRYYVIYSS